MPNNQSAVNNFSLRIIHPIHEHSSGDLIAFKHALALAHAACGELEIIDIRNSEETSDDFTVRGVLEQWGILPPNSERSDVGKLGLKVIKIVKKGEAKRIVSHRIEKHPHDMLVIGTHQRHGLDVLFGQDLAEYLAQTYRQTTLYVPAQARPFVNPDTGAVSLRRVLIPVADDPPADLSFNFLQMLQHVFHRDSVEVTGLHCGDTFPALEPHLNAGNSFREVLSKDPVIAAITETARSSDADLIIMTTRGLNTLPRKIMGGITEHVLHVSPCPVLSIPVM
jgi:nucleotide-binding universal stress UspA family protein